MIERESGERRIQSAVRLCVVLNGLSSETSKKLIDVAYALNSSERLSVSMKPRLTDALPKDITLNAYPKP